MKASVTVVVVPRERFSMAHASLESIFRETEVPFDLVYVDGASPPPLDSYLKKSAVERGFKLIRVDYPLAANEARNLARREIRTPYVVFVDNDVLVRKGWLEGLVEAAERERAWIVGPTYLIGPPPSDVIHMAGGEAHFVEDDGARRFHESHRFVGKRLRDLEGQLSSGPTELVECHTLLVRTEVLDRFGPLDEELKTGYEHIDLCLAVREAGGLVYHEARSVISYVAPPPFAAMDLPYFLLRWSPRWHESSLDRFATKWGLSPDDPYLEHQVRFVTNHRERALAGLMWPLGRISGKLKYSRLRFLGEPLVRFVEARVRGDLVKKRHALRPDTVT